MARNRYFEDEQLTYKFDSSSLKKTLRFVTPYKKIVFTIIPIMLLMSLVAMMPPLINKYIIDNVIIQSKGVFGLDVKNTIILLVSALATIGLSETIFGFFRIIFMSRVGHSVVHDIRHSAFCNLQRLAFDYYDARPAGKILVRLTNYLDEVANVFSSAIVSLIVESSKLVMIVVWLFVLNPYLASIVVVLMIPMAIIMYFLRRAVARRYRTVRNKVSNRTAYIAENVQGTAVTKMFNREKTNTEIYSGLCDDANNIFIETVKIDNFTWPLFDGFFYLTLIAVYLFIFVFAPKSFGGISAGDVVGFIGYMGMIAAPLYMLSTVMQQLTSATTNLERVFETQETPPSIFDKAEAYKLPEIEGNVVFNNVTFGYEKGTLILENFNLDVPKGKMIALVGPTGAGKSTVVNLIPRFYDVLSGSVEIDGHNISNVEMFSLRSQIGVMMQDSFIFSGTILENIRYARPEATEEECIEAAKKVHAHEFIEKLENGYHTKTLENGQGLSSGEKQLLSLARVILSDPKILILDEATSSIDTNTEALIKNALDVILEGRTSFVVAHRLSTIKKADCILYIKDKGIKEAGTHEQLMEKKGLYFKLVTENQTHKI